jgi:uncharacterized membrane protein
LTRFDLSIVLLSALLHALWSAGIKGSRNPLVFNVLQVVPGMLMGLALLPWMELREVPAVVWWLLAATGVAHAVYFHWMTRAFEETDLSIAYPIARSTPAFLPFIAVPLVGDTISAAGAVGIGIVVAGMWLVHTGGDLRWRALVAPGTQFAYLTLLATVAYSLLDKTAMAELSGAPWSAAVPRSVTYYFLLMWVSSPLFLLLAWRRLAPGALRAGLRRDAGPATLAALVSFAGYGLILLALERAPVSYVVTVRQTSVLFAVLIGALWLKERPGRPRLIGACATVAGVALIALAP